MSTTNTSHVVLVDLSNLLHRLLHRPRGLDGLCDAALRELEALSALCAPARLRLAVDAPRSFRRDLIPGYKADRVERSGPSTAELTAIARPALAAAGLKLREADGAEADDVIATLAHAAVSSRCRVSIVSQDSDLLQLVNDATGVRVLWPDNHGGYRELGETAVQMYFAGHLEIRAALRPDQLLDLRAIAGGKDNLPRIGWSEGEREGRSAPYGFTTRRTAALLTAGATLDSLAGEHIGLLTEREAGWVERGHAAALERREALRLRADLVLTASDGTQREGGTPALAAGSYIPVIGDQDPDVLIWLDSVVDQVPSDAAFPQHRVPTKEQKPLRFFLTEPAEREGLVRQAPFRACVLAAVERATGLRYPSPAQELAHA